MYLRNGLKSVISAVVAFAALSFFAGSVLAQGPPINIAQGKFESVAQKNAMRAFRKKGGPKTDAEVKNLGDKLFKHASVDEAVQLKDDKAGNMIHVGKLDPSAHFRINKETGDFSFNKGMKKYLDANETVGLPKGDQAVEIARKHLSDLGELPEKRKEMVVRHIGGLKQVDATPDGKSVERDKLVTVHFGRQIDGVDVGGPGSKIIVQLGANGELVAVNKRWIEVVEEKKRGVDFALELEVKNRMKENLKRDAATAKRVDAQAPEFGYFDDGAGNIEPAYFYEAELTYDLTDEEDTKRKKEHKERYLGVVPALKASKAKFEQLERAKVPPGRDKDGDKDSPAIKD